MKEKIREIASRIRELREIMEISDGDIAGQLGIAIDDYKKYESGEKDIPASILLAIAQFLAVDSSVLLTGEEARMHLFSVTRKGKGVRVDRRKQYDYEALATAFIHKKSDPFIVTVSPDTPAESITPAMHAGQEFNYILEGKVLLNIHGNKITLDQGDSIYFDSSCPHSMQALDGKKAVFLAVVM